MIASLFATGCARTPDPSVAGQADQSAAPAAPANIRPAYAADGALPLIPLPRQVERGTGQFVLDASTSVQVPQGDADARAAADHLAGLLEQSLGHAPAVREYAGAQAEGRAVSFVRDAQLDTAAEGYRLEITPDGIRVRARDAAGLFYGAVSLWQLASAPPQPALPLALPALTIHDAPRFGWRGYMLDSARHITNVEHIKGLLDQMARHKLNVFHWHLTDDQGWRLEIKQYPRLTEVGAWRIPAGKAGRDASGKPVRYGGFFTQDQAREIVAYAAARHITVVPEIELPGHAQAAIAAYPELGVTGQAPPVSPDWGVHTWLFNTDDATFTFLQNVLTEVMDIFPGKYIHIGGDEADKLQWRQSDSIQAHRQRLGLKDDNALQSWFISRIGTFLTAHERRLIGWDEILEGGLPENATVMSWRGINGAVQAAREGHDVVLSPSNITYINRMQSEEADEPPGHDAPITLERIYAFVPVPAQLNAAQARHVLGTQANLWTEHIRTAQRMEHMTFPRLSALAEVAWSPRQARDWNGFLQRLVPQMARFAAADIHVADSAFAVRFEVTDIAAGKASVKLTNQTAFGQIHYTTDGSAPTPQSPQYNAPLQLPLPATVQAVTYVDGRALAAPRTRAVDTATLLSRRAEQLVPCRPKGLTLRLEDDEPIDPGQPDGDRVAVPVDISQPCWTWPDAPVQGMRSLRVQFVDLPYNFQFGGEPPTDAPPKPATQAGELELRAGAQCNGTVLASSTLASATGAGAVKTLDIPLKPGTARQDICLQFTARTREPMRAITTLQWLPQGAP